MPTKRTPAQPAAEPPTPAAAAQQTEAPTLTSLLEKCFRFDADADNESRQLLFDILDREETKEGKGIYPFPVIAADQALHALGVHVGVDALENPTFLELLNTVRSSRYRLGIRRIP
jgi:hypothetical protein